MQLLSIKHDIVEGSELTHGAVKNRVVDSLKGSAQRLRRRVTHWRVVERTDSFVKPPRPGEGWRLRAGTSMLLGRAKIRDSLDPVEIAGCDLVRVCRCVLRHGRTPAARGLS